MTERWTPPLRLDKTGDGFRLSLVGVAHGNGHTLQDAADDLILRLLDHAMAVRTSGMRISGDISAPDRRILEFVWDLGDHAARGEDIRDLVFGSKPSEG